MVESDNLSNAFTQFKDKGSGGPENHPEPLFERKNQEQNRFLSGDWTDYNSFYIFVQITAMKSLYFNDFVIVKTWSLTQMQLCYVSDASCCQWLHVIICNKYTSCWEEKQT